MPQALFDAACRVKSLEGLYIKWSGLANIDALQESSELRYFHLGSSTGLRSIDPLSRHQQLKWLGLENLKRIRDFEPVGELTELEGLTLEGSMWATQRVRTLAPIGKLTNLRYLSITNLRSDDKTLAPLFASTTSKLLTRLCGGMRASCWSSAGRTRGSFLSRLWTGRKGRFICLRGAQRSR